jgi:preprotein translocase subunit Sss1
MNGYKPENHEFMVNGVVHHTRLTRKINFSRITRIIALGLAAIGILAFVLDILIS